MSFNLLSIPHFQKHQVSSVEKKKNRVKVIALIYSYG